MLILRLLVLCRLRMAKDITRGTSTVLDSVVLQVQAVLHRACHSIKARSIEVLRQVLLVLLPAGSVGEGLLEAEDAGSEEDRPDEVEEVLEEGVLGDLRNLSLRITRPFCEAFSRRTSTVAQLSRSSSPVGTTDGRHTCTSRSCRREIALSRFTPVSSSSPRMSSRK